MVEYKFCWVSAPTLSESIQAETTTIQTLYIILPMIFSRRYVTSSPRDVMGAYNTLGMERGPGHMLMATRQHDCGPSSVLGSKQERNK